MESGSRKQRPCGLLLPCAVVAVAHSLGEPAICAHRLEHGIVAVPLVPHLKYSIFPLLQMPAPVSEGALGISPNSLSRP
jgi:hypothetical protein